VSHRDNANVASKLEREAGSEKNQSTPGRRRKDIR
jgi:hypothetical protein